MAEEDSGQSPSFYFSAPAWQVVCTIGAHADGRQNAQIATSVYGASIVEDRPRLLVALWKGNLTHDLVVRSHTLSVGLLAEHQTGLVAPLGIESGRECDKLAGLDTATTVHGDPYVLGSVGIAACRVIDSLEMGDGTTFLVAVEEELRLTSDEPLTWRRAQELLDKATLERYQQKFETDAANARPQMRWL